MIPRRPSRALGFTLLEVMVAVAILGLGLTAILSAQAGVFASSAHARNISLATGLARCKMSEVEEHLARDGFQELDETEQGPCCDGDDSVGLRCSWRVEKPEMPEPKYGELDLDTDLDEGPAGGLGELASLAKGGSLPADPAAGLSGIASTIMGGESGAGGPMAGIAGFVMELVYPDLKTLLEASARRVTVTVTWTEGVNERTLEIQQWVTSPQEAGITGEGVPEVPDPADDVSGTGTGTGSRTSGTGTGKTGPTTGRVTPR